MSDIIQQRIDKKFAELRAAEHWVTAAPGYVKLPYLLGIDTEPVLVAQFFHNGEREHVVIVSPEAIYLVPPENFLSATIKYAMVTEEEEKRINLDKPSIGFMPSEGVRKPPAASP